MTSMHVVKRALVDYFEQKSIHRQKLVERYENDDRNGRSADALFEISKYVLELPDDDPLLKRLAELRIAVSDHDVISLFEEGAFSPPREASDMDDEGYAQFDSEDSATDRKAFQCGFHKPMLSPAAWFASWITALEAEACS